MSSIGDYDSDGVPDVSSGRIWYQGPDFETEHPFRGGHGPLPNVGNGTESKMRFASPYGGGDPDADGVPYVYVFRNVAEADANTGAPITLEPVRVDPLDDPAPGLVGTPEAGMGIGRQIAIGHANTDGILDICVATKVGLAVFLGQ